MGTLVLLGAALAAPSKLSLRAGRLSGAPLALAARAAGAALFFSDYVCCSLRRGSSPLDVARRPSVGAHLAHPFEVPVVLALRRALMNLI